ncbi:MAG TPA: L-histidine N(alpha)-methyltransferase [Dermatophilaceae bacterium]|nr:L-histidine N(alpha)-methyltransferase [Dermatophilaceae bacterium]
MRRHPGIDVYLTAEDLRRTMATDVARGLTATPKELPPKYFYDALGSQLFDRITALPEYYPTRTERAILRAHAEQIVDRSGADTLVELGSGSSEKTELLLTAMGGRLRRYLPVDVSLPALTDAMTRLAATHPGVEVRGVVADFEHHLDQLPTGGRRLVAFLGSTIGNLHAAARHRFLAQLARCLGAGDSFLLGTDLVKDPTRLVAAYDDADGVTAAFNRNVLAVLNRELGADFDPAGFDHVARWDAVEEQMEMWLRARRRTEVRVAQLGLDVRFAAGEQMRTEISAKFRLPGLRRELAAAGLRVLGSWTDAAQDFALTLAGPG